MRFIHYSSELIEYLEERPYNQENLRWQAKPNGLWFSVEGEGLGYGWDEWCKREDFLIENLQYSYEITLKSDSAILHLKTPEEIFEFTKKYPCRTRQFDEEWDTYQLNWEEVKKLHQGIIISPYQWPCRLALESSWYYGWDCSSGCLWDISCVHEFKRII